MITDGKHSVFKVWSKAGVIPEGRVDLCVIEAEPLIFEEMPLISLSLLGKIERLMFQESWVYIFPTVTVFYIHVNVVRNVLLWDGGNAAIDLTSKFEV